MKEFSCHATVNKQSLREEFDQLKKSFESLSSEGKVTPEVTSLFHAMILLFELLIAVFMEKKTTKNGRNSSIPSSQTDKDKTSKRSGTNSKGKKQNGKRGRGAKSDAHNLWERLKKHETAVLLFAKNSHIPFTNNRAERDLRMSKVKQKVSGCFRTKKYADAYCRISSYLQTMANKGYNPLVAIQMAFSGQIYPDRGE